MNSEELTKIFHRVQETRNDELKTLLIAILPKIIPLTSQENIRNEVIKIITEALRRAKLANISLSLELFIELLHPQFLPFGCNFAIAFLDGLSDINCISDIHADSFGRLLKVWTQFELFSYQSNSIAVYLFKYPDQICPAIQFLAEKDPTDTHKVIDLLADLFIDLLLYPVSAIGSNVVPAGLSQARVQRLLLKQKNFLLPAVLASRKQQITEVASQLPAALEYKLIIGLLTCHETSSNDLQYVGKKILNQAKEAYLSNKQNGINLLAILQFILSGFPSFSGKLGPLPLNRERVASPKEVQFYIIDYVQKNVDWLPLPNIESIINIFGEYTNQLIQSQSDASERLLMVTLHLLVDLYQRTNGEDVQLLGFIPRLIILVKTILSQYAYSSTQTYNHHNTSILELKNYSYDLLFLFITKYEYSLSSLLASSDIVSLLLTIAVTDSSTSNSTLFKLLGALEERWDRQFVLAAPNLENQIRALSTSPKSSYRLLYLKWIRKMYGWDTFVLSEMWAFAADTVEMVSNLSNKQFQELKMKILSARKEDNLEIVTPIFFNVVTFLSETMKNPANESKILSNKATFSSLICLELIQESLHLVSATENPFQQPEISIWKQISGENSLGSLTAASQSIFVSFAMSLIYFLEKILKQDHPSNFQSCELHQLEPLILKSSIIDESIHMVDLLSRVLWNHLVSASKVGLLEELRSEVYPKLLSLFSYRKVGRQFIADSVSLFQLTAIEQLPQNYEGETLNNDTALQKVILKFHSMSSLLAGEFARSTGDSVSVISRVRHNLSELTLIFPTITDHFDSSSSLSLSEEILMCELLSTLHFNLSVIVYYITDEQSSVLSLSENLSLPEKLQAFIISKKSTFVSTSAIKCLAVINFLQDRGTAFNLLFKFEFLQNKDKLVYFAIAEKLALLTIDKTHLISSEEGLLEIGVISRLDALIGVEGKSEEKEGLAVILLVILKQWINYPGTLRFTVLERLLGSTIPFLKENNPFLRDIITLNLIHLYEMTIILNQKELIAGVNESILTHQTLDEYISQEIVVAITRRKRPAQRVGFDAGGSSTANNQINSNGENAGANLIPDELLDAVMNSETADANTVLRGMIATATANNATGTNATNAAGGTATNQSAAALDAGYSAYEKVCNITKKIGNGTVLMTALSIVKFDISFGQNQTSFIKKIYQAPTFSIPSEKVVDLIPMLYVAKYDPVTSVREIMQTVWTNLIGVQDKEKLLQYSAAILSYIEINLLNPLWRERESAGQALESLLLLNLSWKSLKEVIVSLLEKGFKLLDDIRESTRKIAINIMKKLLQLILSSCNSKETSETEAKENVDLIFPVLLDKGLISPSIEARGFSLGALIKILNEEPPSILFSWLERLIDTFIESISALEPQMLQYMEFHTNSLQVNREDVEKLRIQLSQHSPVHDALKKCLNMVPFELLGNVCSIAYNHLSHGVGLATRVSAADTFSYLAEKFPSGMAKYGIKAMQELCILISERPNFEISLKKSLINALGMLAKVVEPSILNNECEELVQKYIIYLKEMIIQQYSSSANQEIAYAIVIQQILKKAGERLHYSLSLWLYIIGISYCGSFDQDAEVNHVWLDIFMTSLECSGIGNKLSAIEKSFSVINLMIQYYLNHQSWEKRKQGVRIIRDILTQMNVQSSLKELIFSSRSFLFTLLSMFSLLPGMIWQGQDQLVECLCSLFSVLPNDYYSWEVLPLTSLSNSVIELSIDSNASDGIFQVHDFPFSLGYMIPLSSNEVKESKDGSEPMDVEVSSATTTATSPLSANSNVEIFKQIKEKILFSSLERLRSSIDGLILGRDMTIEPTTSSPLVHALKDWRLNVNALLYVLFYEIKRGDTNYRVIVGQALASLPWKEIQTQSQEIYVNHFPTLLSLCELNSEDSTPPPTPPSAVADSKPKPQKNTPAHKNTLYFGSRYGAAATKTTIKKPSVKINSEPVVPPPSETSITLIPVKRNFKYTPAVRMHIIDCLSKGWFNLHAPSSDLIDVSSLSTAIPLILKNIIDLFDQEVWSLKRSYVQLIASIGQRTSHLPTEYLANMIHVIEKSQSENKFHQVKIAGLEALEQILKGENQIIVKSHFQERITKVLHQAALDTQPSVLEFIAKISHLSV